MIALVIVQTIGTVMIVLIKLIILIIRTITGTAVLRMKMTIITVIGNQLFGFNGNNDSKMTVITATVAKVFSEQP